MESSQILKEAVNIALKAGQLLKKGYGTLFEISSKEGKHNLVTEYDFLSEKLIIEMIEESFPSHQILSEEYGEKGEDHEYKWVIDPLDGTVNFAHSIPLFAVSIGVLKDNVPLCGVVYNPIAEELFYAEKNKGAIFNDTKISVSNINHLDKAILATGFPYNLAENPLRCIEKFTNVLKLGIPLRRLGVASLDLCYVAAGRFDGFWEVGLQPWDCAAGVLIIQEAGGKVTTLEMEDFDILLDKPIIGSNALLHNQMCKVLSE